MTGLLENRTLDTCGRADEMASNLIHDRQTDRDVVLNT